MLHLLYRSLFISLYLFLNMIALSSCVPSEKSLTQAIVDGDTTMGGFTGVASVQTLSQSQVRVSWVRTTSNEVTAYNIYNTTLPSAPVLIKTVAATASETTISGLNRNVVYRFRVKAVGEQNREDVNTRDEAGIPYGGATSVSVVSSTSAQIFYSPMDAGEVLNGTVYCHTNTNPEYSPYTSITNMNLSSVIIDNLVTNTQYTCRVSVAADGLEDNNTQTVSFTALGSADHLVFFTQPGNSQAGVNLPQQPRIHILDENNNIVSGGPDSTALITLEMSSVSPTGGSVRGAYSINAVAGVAAFTDINFQEAGIKIITARKSDTSAFSFGTPEMTLDSNSFTISSGNISPDLTTITIDPPIIPPFDALVANGVDSYQVIFTLRDQFGNPVSGIRPQFTSNISGDLISQPLLNSDASGVTTGSIATTVADTNPARILSISSPSGLHAIQVAAPFKPGPATRLAFIAQPLNSPAGLSSMNEVRIGVQDSQGNLVISGAAASSPVALSIFNNVSGAVLTGTNPITTTNGIAIFNDLGIDRTGNSYRLNASSGALSTATSNTFNITAGMPRALALTGPTSVRSGQCSTAIILQLRDLGGNPANATQNTMIQLSGLASSSLYTSNTCGGAAQSTTVTFSPGTNSRTFYLRNNQSLALNITAVDTNAILTSANYALNVTPSKLRMVAEAAPPAPAGTQLTVLSGQCSSRILLTPLAEDDSLAQVFGSTNLSINGLSMDARIYSDSSCNSEISAASFPMTVGAPPNSQTYIYLRSPRGENLTINAVDPLAQIATTSLPQEVKIVASKIVTTGPSTVVAGVCSTAFTVSLKDTLDNNVPAHQAHNLVVNGVNGVSTSGRFYTSASCTGGGSNTTITIPSNAATTTVYFKSDHAEILNIFISDAAGLMTQSAAHQLTISPSALRITPPAAPVSSLVSQCRGPFILDALDGVGTVAPVVVNVQANLTGAGTSGAYYNDASCEIRITSTTFLVGQSTKNFYFKGQYPEVSLTLTATDNAGVLASSTHAWAVIADLSWIGTSSTQLDNNGRLLPFRTGIKPVAARYDGLRETIGLAFSPDKRFLFVTDAAAHRVIKYDYQNMEYRGWIGRLKRENGIGSSGSNQADPSNSLCNQTSDNASLPGWCVGGLSTQGNESLGGFNQPRGVTVDDTYVYVSNNFTNSISRHRLDNGAFEGWLGLIGSAAPIGPATGGPASCSSTTSVATPGWCRGGNINPAISREGDGRLPNPHGMKTNAVYLYVVVSGAVLRFNKSTGSFQGWIGIVNTNPTSGALGCSSTNNGQRTPGWCFGGSYQSVSARNFNGVAGGVRIGRDLFIGGTNLYVLSDDSVINRYNIDTGAFIETLSNLNFGWTQPMQMDFDGTYFYVADDERILKVTNTGLIESWIGKVANPSGMSGGSGCTSLQTNQNTPGWCSGGTTKAGFDETSFYDNWSIALDGAGSFITASRNVPTIKKFSTTTGQYQGSMGLESTSPRSWTGDKTKPVELYGFDDHSTYNPSGVTTIGDYIFMAEADGSRIKKINKRTGELLGWIGGITSIPTGGELPGCLSANAMGPSPGWCLGSLPYPSFASADNLLGTMTDGIMTYPYGLTSDGVWLYVTDFSLSRIQRFNVNTGTYGGWIGRIGPNAGDRPTGGDPGCNGAAINTPTPGWCFGGWRQSGTGDGHLKNPSGIAYQAGNLYVVDSGNYRVVSYNAVTGTFNGWIGRIDTPPTGGCATGSNGSYLVSTSGWCTGGTAGETFVTSSNRGGGFRFVYGNSFDRGDIYADATHLYVANTASIRIDKITLNGELVASASTRHGQYANTWRTAPADIANIGLGLECSLVHSIWGDDNFIYGFNANNCGSTGNPGIWKMNKSTGTIVGWRGAINFDALPTGGDPGCSGATGVTPGWCQGGGVASGSTLGGFYSTRGMITGDSHFLYVTDKDGNRLTRIPK